MKDLEYYKNRMQNTSYGAAAIVINDPESGFISDSNVTLVDATLEQTYEEARQIAQQLALRASQMASVAGSLKKMMDRG